MNNLISITIPKAFRCRACNHFHFTQFVTPQEILSASQARFGSTNRQFYQQRQENNESNNIRQISTSLKIKEYNSPKQQLLDTTKSILPSHFKYDEKNNFTQSEYTKQYEKSQYDKQQKSFMKTKQIPKISVYLKEKQMEQTNRSKNTKTKSHCTLRDNRCMGLDCLNDDRSQEVIIDNKSHRRTILYKS